MSLTDRAHVRPGSPEIEAAGESPEEQKSPRLLIVSNDATIGAALEEPLCKAGYAPTRVPGGRAALEALRGARPPSLVILDLSLHDLPATDFLVAVRAQRAVGSVPIIAITRKNTEADRIAAFELGADDLVSAPFSVREILLRIRVQLRRPATASERTGVLEMGALKLDRDSHRVWLDERELALSAREFRLLQVLMEHGARVLSRRLLLDLAWGSDANVGVRAVDAYVNRLRRKLGEGRDYVETVSSVGYRLRRIEPR